MVLLEAASSSDADDTRRRCTVTTDELSMEGQRARKLRQLVDKAASRIREEGMSRAAAEPLVGLARPAVLPWFRDRAFGDELIDASPFSRLVEEFALPARNPGWV